MTHFKTTEHYSRVRQLNAKIDPESVPREITMPDAATRELRARLILEEALETIDALGFTVELPDDYDRGCFPVLIEGVKFEATHEPDMVEIADGCADISVVTMGTLVACGIPDVDLFRLVDTNNLAKFAPGSYRREDGKWIKPPSHQPPDIGDLLMSFGWDPTAPQQIQEEVDRDTST